MYTLINIINIINININLKKYKINVKKFNRLSLSVLKILQNLNIIESFILSSNFKDCIIYLNSNISFKLINISKSNRYIYFTLQELIKLRTNDLFNDYIISINNKTNSIVTIDDAIRLQKGGLLLVKIIKIL